MMQRLLRAFGDFGYSQLTMGGLANACDLSPRALYNHFKGKEDAFRETMRWNLDREMQRGWEAGQWIFMEGGSAIDVVVGILDARFGDARRNLETSPHASELNLEAFRRCRDIMEDAANAFQAGFALVIADLEKQNLVRLHPNQSTADAAQLLVDGARGVNQSLPNVPAPTLVERYRRMSEALMYGFADRAAFQQNRQVVPRRAASEEDGRTENLRASRNMAAGHARAEGGI